MKKTAFIVLILTVFISCKNDSKSEKREVETSTDNNKRTEKQSDGLTLLKGDYSYYDGAAVLQTNTEIYGVLLTNKFEELNKSAESLKNSPTDHVKIEIRGKISNEKHEKILWENKVEVVEILNVKLGSEIDKNVIKLGS